MSKLGQDDDIQRAEAFLSAPDEGQMSDSDNNDVAEHATSLAVADGEVSPERMAEVNKLGEKITETLQTVFDPEIPVNIYDMGLIYKIDVHDDDSTTIEMTLTSPHCPVAETLPIEVEEKIKTVDGVHGCEVKIVWEPPWHPQMMSEEAQLELGMIY